MTVLTSKHSAKVSSLPPFDLCGHLSLAVPLLSLQQMGSDARVIDARLDNVLQRVAALERGLALLERLAKIEKRLSYLEGIKARSQHTAC